MSEIIKLCAMVVRAVFVGETEDNDMVREPYVAQAVRARDEHDGMRDKIATLTRRAEEAERERDAVLTEALCARDLRKLLDQCEVDLQRAVRYVGGDDIEDVMQALKDGGNLAIDHETTVRLLDAANRECDRWRHGVTVEGDFVCPGELRADAARAECERMRAVVEAAHHITRCHDLSCVGPPCTCGLDALIDALRACEGE